VPLYFVGSLAVLGAAALVAILAAMVYAERDGEARTFAAVGRAAHGVGADTIALVRSVYDTGRQVGQDSHAQLIEPVTFPLDPGLAPVRTASGVDLAHLYVRRTPAARPGWRLIVGMFALAGERRHAVLALDPEMTVRHVWPLHERGVEVPDEIQIQTPFYKFPHGFAPLPDGSIVFGFDHGKSLRRFDACGRELWTRVGGFHHAVTYDPTTHSLWTLRGGQAQEPGVPLDEDFHEYIVELDADDGATLRQFHLDDVMAANPELDVLGVRQLDDHERDRPKWAQDPHHINDVDPLPTALADRFAGFEAGDLLLSFRSLNLVAVVDPDTLAIRWWRGGFVRRQHDPDWLPDGRLLVFDNNMNRGPSRIVAIDPADFAVERLVHGADHHSNTGIRGKHQRLPDGTIAITSAMQGRVFEVAPDGSVAFELVNFLDDSKAEVIVVSEATWLPADAFALVAFSDCTAVVAER